MKKWWLSFYILITVINLSPVSSQEYTAKRGDFWICPGAEMALYSISSAACGGSIAMAYGRGASIGLKASLFFDIENQIDTLELGLLLRYYFFGGAANSGPFIQFTGGPALFFDRENTGIPAELGSISAGLHLGWRFLLGETFFVEPSVRGGFPFIAGAGLSAGVRF